MVTGQCDANRRTHLAGPPSEVCRPSRTMCLISGKGQAEWRSFLVRAIPAPPEDGAKQRSHDQREASRLGNDANRGAVVIEIGCAIGIVAGGIGVVGPDGVEDVV